MSFLYYENLPEVYSTDVANAIMYNTYNGIKPYFSFIDKVIYRASRRILSVEVERASLEDIVAEERKIFGNQTNDEQDLQDSFEKRVGYQFRLLIRIVSKGEGVLYRIVDDEEDEDIENKKDKFLSSDYVFPRRRLEDPRKIEVLTSYSPYDLLVLRADDLSGKPLKMRLYLRSNLYQYGVIRKSLEQLLNTPKSHNRNLIRIFENIKVVNFNEVKKIHSQEFDWIFLKDQKRPGNEAQREFVEIALGTPDFAILEGPPGSGKTTTICELIYQAIKRKQRVLLVASTHVAVDNVLEKLMDENSPVFSDVRKYALPIRIGRTHRISDLATRYHLESYWRGEKKILCKRIQKIQNKTESQQLMLGFLEDNKEDSPDYLKRVFTKAANIVCGTTIGILQHPEIKQLRYENKTIIRPYDLLILDEASKTTFQEFLVPALLAKKFIIVGDIKQLSPFVDEEAVVSNISLDSPDEGDLITFVNNLRDINQISRTPVKCIKVIDIALKSEEIELLESLCKDDFPVCILEDKEKIDRQKILGSSLIVGRISNLKKQAQFLPLGINWINEGKDAAIIPIRESSFYEKLILWKRKNEYVSRKKEDTQKFFSNDESWNDAVGWRLIRDYELRLLDDSRYWQQIEKFIPEYWEKEKRSKTLRSLSDIKRLSFPSIIELLQKGFDRSKLQEEINQGLCITDGLPENILEQRHRILKFQHRMHPEISAFPRSFFYDDQALIDLPNIEEERFFGYENYKNRKLWLDVKLSYEERKKLRKNRNEKEANVILSELDELLAWTKKTPKTDGKPWEIAILPFYKSQESLIRIRLQSKFRTKRRRTFYMRNQNAIIELCVVDRFQGHEADIVFISLVRNRGFGFLDTPNRLNVALTRAKYQLVIVGNHNHFLNQSRSEMLSQLAKTSIVSKIYGEKK